MYPLENRHVHLMVYWLSHDNPRNPFLFSFTSVLWTVQTLSFVSWNIKSWSSWISSKTFSYFGVPFTNCLFIEQYVHIYWDIFVYSFQYYLYVYFVYIKCFYICKWAYLVLGSIYSIHHEYTNANIGRWCVGTWLNIVPTTNQGFQLSWGCRIHCISAEK